jgi:DNA-binding winged helix-turn-helix (wHTH) protein
MGDNDGVRVFGEFEFDGTAMRLRRKGSVAPIVMTGQCLELLVLMLARPGELITREEIVRELWPDSNVDFDHGLDVLVNRLRLVLGDSSRSPSYIQTVPKKGYRFVAQVRRQEKVGPLLKVRLRRLSRYAAVAVVAAIIGVVIAHTRYDTNVPGRGAAVRTSR